MWRRCTWQKIGHNNTSVLQAVIKYPLWVIEDVGVRVNVVGEDFQWLTCDYEIRPPYLGIQSKAIILFIEHGEYMHMSLGTGMFSSYALVYWTWGTNTHVFTYRHALIYSDAFSKCSGLA